MLQEKSIREHIASYLRGDASVADLDRCVSAASREMFKSGSADVIDLVASVQLLLSELYDDVLNEGGFRDELTAVLNTITLDVLEPLAPYLAAPPPKPRYSAANGVVWLTPPPMPALLV